MVSFHWIDVEYRWFRYFDIYRCRYPLSTSAVWVVFNINCGSQLMLLLLFSPHVLWKPEDHPMTGPNDSCESLQSPCVFTTGKGLFSILTMIIPWKTTIVWFIIPWKWPGQIPQKISHQKKRLYNQLSQLYPFKIHFLHHQTSERIWCWSCPPHSRRGLLRHRAAGVREVPPRAEGAARARPPHPIGFFHVEKTGVFWGS